MRPAREGHARSRVWRRELLWAAGWAIAALAVWQLRAIVILAFASILIALALSTLAEGLRRVTRAPRGVALAVVVILTLGFVAGATALFGWRVADQFDVILAKTQASLHAGLTILRQHSLGRLVVERLSSGPIDGATANVAPALASILGSLGENLAYAGVVVASGVFLAIDPARHIRAILLLAPPSRRADLAEFIDACGAILRKWLVSRLVVMLSIGVLSSAGLWLLGIDGAITLGVTGGLLTFIPLIGALMAAVPAILVAAAQSPLLALYTALMYWAVHFIEGTFITPYVQDEEVDLPPVMTMYSALVFAALFGATGVFLASPIALVCIVAVRRFYVERRGAAAATPSPQKP